MATIRTIKYLGKYHNLHLYKSTFPNTIHKSFLILRSGPFLNSLNRCFFSTTSNHSIDTLNTNTADIKPKLDDEKYLKLDWESVLSEESLTDPLAKSITASEFRERLSLIEACLRSGQQSRAQILFRSLQQASPTLSKRIVDIHVHNSFLESLLVSLQSSSSAADASSSMSDIGASIEGLSESSGLSRSNRHHGHKVSKSADHFGEMLKWFQGIKESGVTPNVTSYALLLKGSLVSHPSLHQSDIYSSSVVTSALPGAQGLSVTNDNDNDCRNMVRLIADDLKRTLKSYDISIDNVLEAHYFSPEDVTRLQRYLAIGKSSSDTLSSNNLSNGKQLPSSAFLDLSGVSAIDKNEKIRVFDTVTVPEIKQAESSNMNYVKQTLNATQDTSKSALELQLHIEQESFRINMEYLLNRSDKVRSVTGIGILPQDVKTLLSHWHRGFTTVLKRELVKMKSEVESDATSVAPFLEIFGKHVEKISAATISQFVKAFNNGEPHVRAVTLVSGIGEALEHEYKMLLLSDPRIKEKFATDYHKHQEHLKSKRLLDRKFRKLQAMDVDRNISGMFAIQSWERSTKIRIGSVLAAWFIQNMKIPVSKSDTSQINFESFFQQRESSADIRWLPAFSHGYHRENAKQYGIINVHEAVVRAMDGATSTSSASSASDRSGVVLPKLLPMIIPPRPWLTHESGGYLTIKVPLVRSNDMQIAAYLREGSLSGKLEPVLNALDILSQTPWRVHDKLLKHVVHAWNSGMSIAKLPKDLPPTMPEMPPKPDDFDKNPAARYKWYEICKELKKEYWELKSLRISENYKIEIARTFLGKTLYFPHNIDFRGRAYPIPQLFNHMGNDLSRSLLIFDKAKPLGETGLRWLKIHLSNVYGNDKISFDERVSFIDQNIELIRLCAEDPFAEGNDWWLHGDKPWLTLSAAMEINEALKCEKPETYESRLPIHQDGSCNGLQHYAALGGDLEGAIQVNLTSSGDRPADVYSAVASIVQEKVARDSELDDVEITEADKTAFLKEEKRIKFSEIDTPFARKLIASIFPPTQIERKTVKQTVMTSVYGVTFIGAREQIRNRIKEKYADRFTSHTMSVIAHYLAKKTFEALNDTFKNAHDIQYWLASVSREIARSVEQSDLDRYFDILRQQEQFRKEQRLAKRGLKKKSKDVSNEDTVEKNANASSVTQKTEAEEKTFTLNTKSAVIWTTPIGFTALQPYKSSRNREVRTALQSFILINNSFKAPVDVAKQSAAFPPNFIHSLDATHMFMTALECGKQEDPITFASVHDSYWTHACDIPRLRTVLREKFVELHSTPILENIYEEFKERYGNRKVHNLYSVEEFSKKLDTLNTTGSGVKYKLDQSQKKLVFDYASSFGIDKNASSSSDSQEEESGFEAGGIDERHFVTDEDLSDGDVELPILGDNPNASDSILSTQNTEQDIKIDEEQIAKMRKKVGVAKNVKFVKVWEDITIPPVPQRGTFNVDEVKKSEYFFN